MKVENYHDARTLTRTHRTFLNGPALFRPLIRVPYVIGIRFSINILYCRISLLGTS